MPITIDPDLLDDYLEIYNPIIGTAASDSLYGTAVPRPHRRQGRQRLPLRRRRRRLADWRHWQ